MPNTITSITTLLASIPAFFGFVPTESVVMLGARGPEGVGVLATRVDLDDAGVTIDLPYVSAVMEHQGVTHVHVVVVSDGAVTTQHPVLSVFADHFRDNTTIVVQSLVQVSTLGEAGRLWWDHLTGGVGITADYRDSIATAEKAASGEAVLDSRASMEAQFARDDTRQAGWLHSATVDAVAAVRDVIAAMHDHRLVDEQLAAKVAAVIRHRKDRRDAILRTVIYNAVEAAEVFTRCATMLSGQDRADVLTLSVVAHYCAGRGSVARSALEVAASETSTPDNLLVLTSKALDRGLHPDKFSQLLGDLTDDTVASGLLGGEFPPYE